MPNLGQVPTLETCMLAIHQLFKNFNALTLF